MIVHDTQRIDFDSSQSVVSGNIGVKGTGVTLYGLYEWEGPYLDVALGLQKMSIDSLRDIVYPSFNIAVESVSARATGNTNSTNTVGTFEFGWPVNVQAFGIDPALRVEYRHVAIDGFAENSVYTGGTRTGMPAGYGFTYGDQSAKSLDASAGLKLRYTFRPSFGVVIPYVKAEFHHNFETDPFTVSATYDGVNSGAASFELPSDAQTKNFKTYGAGLSMVLPHGWQLFAQYQATSGISYLSHHIVSGGVRGEF
jgi:outer membrane autotransporter protein